MRVKEELHILTADLSPEREKIIQRIINLSDEQFEQFLTLYSQQETESYQSFPAQRPASA